MERDHSGGTGSCVMGTHNVRPVVRTKLRADQRRRNRKRQRTNHAARRVMAGRGWLCDEAPTLRKFVILSMFGAGLTVLALVAVAVVVWWVVT